LHQELVLDVQHQELEVLNRFSIGTIVEQWSDLRNDLDLPELLQLLVQQLFSP